MWETSCFPRSLFFNRLLDLAVFSDMPGSIRRIKNGSVRIIADTGTRNKGCTSALAIQDAACSGAGPPTSGWSRFISQTGDETARVAAGGGADLWNGLSESLIPVSTGAQRENERGFPIAGCGPFPTHLWSRRWSTAPPASPTRYHPTCRSTPGLIAGQRR